MGSALDLAGMGYLATANEALLGTFRVPSNTTA